MRSRFLMNSDFFDIVPPPVGRVYCLQNKKEEAKKERMSRFESCKKGLVLTLKWEKK
jgi:hypothetical protein